MAPPKLAAMSFSFLGQARRLNGRARGQRLAEVARVDLVHRPEVLEIGEKNRRLHDRCVRRAGRGQHGAEILQHALALEVIERLIREIEEKPKSRYTDPSVSLSLF